MSVQAIVEFIVTFVKEHESWAIPIAFLVAFGESFAFLSILWPGTAILVGITALLAASGASQAILWPAVIAAGLGGTLGYAVSYWIGLYFKDSIPNIWPFRSRPELIQHGENFFSQWGGWGVFFGHFFGPVRSVIPVVAGMFRMPQIPFQIANIASAFIWAAGVIMPSFFLVTFRDEIVAFVREYQFYVAAALFVIACANSIPMPLLAVPTLLLFVVLGAAFLYAEGSLALALLAGAGGAFLGDILAYRWGAAHKGDLHTIWEKSWSPEAADQAVAVVQRRGPLSVILSKFHTTRRSFVPLAAGAAPIPFGTFFAVALLSCVIWAAVLLSPVPLLMRLLGGPA